MDKLRIKLDFSNGPIWKDKYNSETGEWSTGIDVVDHDYALAVLDREAQRMYSGLYRFDADGVLHFDHEAYEASKGDLLSLIQAIVQRAKALSDGTYVVVDEVAEKAPTMLDRIRNELNWRERTSDAPKAFPSSKHVTDSGEEAK